MRLIIDLARGMLSRRRRQTLVSVLGVALGVAFFIAITSIMRGFQTYFIQQVIDVQPHIVIKDETRNPTPQAAQLAAPGGAVAINGVKPVDRLRGIRAPGERLAVLEAIPGAAAAPILTGAALLRYGSRDVSVTVTGVDPTRYARVSNIEKDMLSGRLEDLRSTANGLIIGDSLALRLGVQLGDTVVAVSPRGVSLQMKVVGLFHTGLATMDQSSGYVLLKVNQVLQDRPNVVNQILLRLADVTRAEPLAREIEDRFGERTESWEEQNRNILTVFVIQNAIMYSVTGAILLVAAFGIYNIISTVVFEKTRDIAILKSLGFTETTVRRIFLLEALMIGLAGTIVGWMLGYVLCRLLGLIEFKSPFMDATTLPLYYSPAHYLLAATVALTASAIAGYLPARKAARQHPVEIIRGAS